MDEATETTRLPPQVIRIYPPPLTVKTLIRPVRRRLIAYLIVLAVSVACVVSPEALIPESVLKARWWSDAQGRTVADQILAAVSVVGFLYFTGHVASAFEWSRLRPTRPAGRNDGHSHPSSEEASDPSRVMLSRWGYGYFPPKPSVVRAELEHSSVLDCCRANILCVRNVELPEPTIHTYEPEIVPLGALPWNALRQMGIAVCVAGLLGVLQQFGILSLGVHPLVPIGLLVFPSLLILAFWLLKRQIRPTYLRLAPGVLQIIQFPLGLGGKPHIRAYRMEPGTVAVVYGAAPRERRKFGGSFFLLAMLAGSRCDTIWLWQLPEPQETMRKILKAIQSTAPIPEMSDTELVG